MLFVPRHGLTVFPQSATHTHKHSFKALRVIDADYKKRLNVALLCGFKPVFSIISPSKGKTQQHCSLSMPNSFLSSC